MRAQVKTGTVIMLQSTELRMLENASRVQFFYRVQVKLSHLSTTRLRQEYCTCINPIEFSRVPNLKTRKQSSARRYQIFQFIHGCCQMVPSTFFSYCFYRNWIQNFRETQFSSTRKTLVIIKIIERAPVIRTIEQLTACIECETKYLDFYKNGQVFDCDCINRAKDARPPSTDNFSKSCCN